MLKHTSSAFILSLLCLFSVYIVLVNQYHSCYLTQGVSSIQEQNLERTSNERIQSNNTRQHLVREPNHLVRSSFELAKDRIQRAIVIFYPNNQENKYLPELRWLYRSWIEMMNQGELKTWRTDLIIFTGNYSSNLQKLACVFNRTRSTKDEPPLCRVFHYERISNRYPSDNIANETEYTKRSYILYENFHKYQYIDSINVIFEGYSMFNMYDYILRTDIDVFLTKYFGLYVPITSTTLLTGRGAYSVSFSTNRLRRIARDMGWEYANMSNIGSTW
jgi:hypothetical protein